MDTKEFKKALQTLSKEKGIKEDVIYDAMELALTSAYKKNYHSLSNVRVNINRETGEIHVYSFKTVVKDEENEALEPIMIEETDEEGNVITVLKPYVYDERIHIILKEALKIVPDIKIGETIEEEVTPKDFGRVAAATAKQVVIQKIKEAEKSVILEEFTEKEHELVTGIVAMEDVKNYFIDLGRTQGILPKTDIIPGEVIKMGSNIKVYVSRVDATTKSPLILLSRKHFNFIKRLFELEIPEINEGLILIHNVARQAGLRTKISLSSTNPNIDAIGSCIGERGNRIANILKEIDKEKLDLVEYSDDKAKYIENALSPAKNMHVLILDEQKKEALVIVDKQDLSLAIGKSGINVKLATRLTGFTIDIKTKEQAKEMGINII